MRQTVVILSFLIVCCQATAQPTSGALEALELKPADMQQDFRFLRRALVETHPGLYRYMSKEAMTKKMDSISVLLNKPMNFYDFYLILSDLIANIRCAHTYLVPKKGFEGFYLNDIKTFPLMIFFVEGKYYVTVNGTPDKTIK